MYHTWITHTSRFEYRITDEESHVFIYYPHYRILILHFLTVHFLKDYGRIDFQSIADFQQCCQSWSGTKNKNAQYVDSPFIATSPGDDAIFTVNGEVYASEKIENAILHKDSTCTITAPGTTKKLTGQSSYNMDINSENGPYDISFEYLSYNGTYYDTATIAEEYKLDLLRYLTAE